MNPEKIAFRWLLITHLVIIICFFDAKMSVGGDDSDYIIAAHNFWDGLKFPSWHGSFYPIFLSIFTPLFHYNTLAYKLLSVALALAHFFLIYKAFNKRVPQPVLFFLLVITCINWQLAYYLSTTYSEVLFMLLQASFFCLFFFIEDHADHLEKRKLLLYWLALGAVLFMLAITRNNGIGGIIALAIYLVLNKRWRDLALIVGIFVVFQALFTVYKNALWDFKGTGLEDQLKHIAYKDFYKPSQGTENFKGFVERFWMNSMDYLSHHLGTILGFRGSDPRDYYWKHSLVAAAFYGAFAISGLMSFKKNNTILLISIYLFVMMGITFITMQTQWSQERLILVYLPLICASFGFLIYTLTDKSKKVFKTASLAVMAVIILLVFVRMILAPKKLSTSITNLTSERHALDGYDNEWKSYILMSKWAGENLELNANIVCRKPSLATVYSGRSFLGISNFDSNNGDTAVAYIENRKIDYILYDHLQMNAAQRLAKYYVARKPLGLKTVGEIGSDKTTMVLKVCRDEPKDVKEYMERLHTGMFVLPDVAYFYLAIGDKLLELRKFSNAIPYYEKACQLSPDDLSYIKRAWAYFEMGNYQKAQADVLNAIKLQPNKPEYNNLLNEIKKRL